MDLQYGKKNTCETYHDNKLVHTTVEYSIPQLIRDKAEALNEMMKALDMLTTNRMDSITIIVETDFKTKKLRLLTKKYRLDNERIK